MQQFSRNIAAAFLFVDDILVTKWTAAALFDFLPPLRLFFFIFLCEEETKKVKKQKFSESI